jgi:predicted lipoprotein with Yx(FWY)xxD motif
MEAVARRTGRGHAVKRSGGILAAVALSVGAVAVSSLAASTPASAKTATERVLTIKTERVPNVGTVLATTSGHTLYRFTVDPAGKATCVGACAKVWPPLLLPRGVTHIKAPRSVKGLSTVRVAGGRLQVFFHHEALYGFVSDHKKGQATGQDVEHDWFAVLSNGKSSAPAPAPASATSGNGSGPGPGPGPGPGTAPTTTAPAATPGTSTPATTPSTPATPTTSPPEAPPTTMPPTTTPPTSPPPPTTTTTTTNGGTGGTAF